MCGIGNKKKKRLYRWMASLLAMVLLFNESGISVLAAGLQEAGNYAVELEEETGAQSENTSAQAKMWESETPETIASTERRSEENETQETQEQTGESEEEESEASDPSESSSEESGADESESIESSSGSGTEPGESSESGSGEDKTDPSSPSESGSEGGESTGESGSTEESKPTEGGDSTEESKPTEGGDQPGGDVSPGDAKPGDDVSSGDAKPGGDVSSGDATVVVSRTADVVFVIDATASMGRYITDVKNKIGNFIQNLSKADVDVRVKFVFYYDITPGNDPKATVCSDWCSTTEDATKALGVTVTGGGDGPETAVDGMGHMFEPEFGWRENVTKFSILLTDAPTKENNSFKNPYTFKSIAEKLEQEGIVSSTITDPNSSIAEGINDYSSWVTNGGKAGDITKEYDIILKMLEEIIVTTINKNSHIINASAGEGGSISPSGGVIVRAGEDQTFIITPNDGYEIDTVMADGSAVALEDAQVLGRARSESIDTENNNNINAKQYTFHAVGENHTLSATFRAIAEPESDDTPIISVPKDSEPKTGDVSRVEVYATTGMIAGFSYLLLYFSEKETGMTEEKKKEIVGALVSWGRKGKRFRRYVALAIIFMILVYYHSIGKRTTEDWKVLCTQAG